MTLKIDLRRILPGLVILLVGVALFVFWLLLVFVSFFAFFVPELRGIFYIGLDILVASVVMMVAGGVVIFASTSGWWREAEGADWFGGAVATRRDRDSLTPGQRFGELFGVLVSVFIVSFFVENQVRDTGFFTSLFGPVEQSLFYGTWAVGVAVSLARAAYGRRNPVRPLDAAYGLMLAATAVWLFEVFPFDFAHLTDLMPGSVRFLFSWVDDPIGYVILVLTAVGGFVSMLYNSVLFFFVRSRHQYPGAPSYW